MTTKAQSLINRWAIKRYKLDLNAEIILDTSATSSGCPTCGDSSEAVITVYVSLPGRGLKELDTFYDFHRLMNEILSEGD